MFEFPTFRDLGRKISPPWMRKGTAEKIIYAVLIQVDALGEVLTASLKLRFPNLYSDESLPIIGRERRIRRGPRESAESYAQRLRRWLDDHPRRGNAMAMLQQLRAYFLPLRFPMHFVNRSGARYIMDEDGQITRDVISTEKFDQWARWWLLLYSDDLGEDDFTDEELALIPREWIAAHCIGELIVMRSDSVLWDYPPDAEFDDPDREWDMPDDGRRLLID